MPCQLARDPNGIHRFTAPTGAIITLCIDCSSGLAHLTAANFNNSPLPVNDPCVTLPPLAAGPNLLIITVISPDAQDTITVKEDCADGSKRPVDQYTINPNDPARGYVIVGR